MSVLVKMEGGGAVLLFIRLFSGRSVTFGMIKIGEQGDPLMPAFLRIACGQDI